MLPPGRSGLSIDTHPKPGTGPPVGPFAGQASSQRTRRARMPPIMRPRSPRVRNCLPIILWSVQKTYWRMKPTSRWTAAWRASTWVMASLMTCRSSVAQGGRGEQRADLVLARPGLVLLGRLHVEPAPHPGVAETAQLGTGDLVLARPGDLEPGGDRVPGHRVLLEAGARDEEAVDHVARLEQHADRLVDGDVDVVVHDHVVVGVELAVGARVGDLPVELLGGHLDHHVRGRDVLLDVGPGLAADEGEDDEQDGGRDGPRDLERGVAVAVGRPAPVLVAIEHEEDEERDLHHQKGRPRDVVDDVEEAVYVGPG